MIRGIYTAAAGLATAQLRLGVVSNNIANAQTVGYKQDRLPDDVTKSIDLQRYASNAQGQPIGAVTLGPGVGLSQLDLTAGPMQETSNPLDLAIGGSGFFSTRAPDGTVRYTRDGGFHQDVDGSLRARDGSAVLDTNGQPITLPQSNDIAVAADGTITADGNQVAQLQMVDFAAGTQLNKVGNGMFTAPAGTAPQATNGVQVYQGYVEASNVDMSESMVATMSLVRAYEANQKLLQMQDETLRATVNDVGKATG
ncbi:MAG: flagellar basal-body rod protein FlgF [Chloroflexi bacterium]|nr:flagellar basal-body rod protein FlgF [Chloroflexota bacterium]MBV9131311.1 flagellar basal-body rod protein FlgF [Chloroflexota bacterium]MBV9894423.1 flagellar basal-body rod protein FlgF [Chloroflexota bacterium]